MLYAVTITFKKYGKICLLFNNNTNMAGDFASRAQVKYTSLLHY